MSSDPRQTTIQSGWQVWLAAAFLAPIATWLWMKDVTRHGR
jgi:hypothetical protein